MSTTLPVRRVYLSGGMEYADNEGRDWRGDMERWIGQTLGWDVFNPNRESERFLSARLPGCDFRSLKTEDPALFRATVRDIVELDCKEIAERSDIVVCLWDDGARKGAGTKGELTMARYFGKPVYLVTTVPEAEIPGWVLGCTSDIFRDFEELKNFLLVSHRGPA